MPKDIITIYQYLSTFREETDDLAGQRLNNVLKSSPEEPLGKKTNVPQHFHLLSSGRFSGLSPPFIGKLDF